MPVNGHDKLGKRKFGFFSTRLPLTSKRVRDILSDVENSQILAEAIRNEREGESDVFQIKAKQDNKNE